LKRHETDILFRKQLRELKDFNGDMTAMKQRAIELQAMLGPYHPLKESLPSYQHISVDKTSQEYLPHCQEGFEEMVPLKTLGDGRCLFNSYSLKYNGDYRYVKIMQ
jgi:hypothetical protein